MFESSGSIGVVSAAGGAAAQVGTLDDAYYAGPIWSPDGAWIVAARMVGAQVTSELVALPVDGGEEISLATGVMYAAAWRASD